MAIVDLEEMMLRAATQRLSIPVAQGAASHRRLLSTALPPPQRRLLSRGLFARGALPSNNKMNTATPLSIDTNALSHYKRERLLEKIGFGIHNSRRDARRLRLGALRSLASPRTRTTHLTTLHRAYGVLEACLDAQVAALDKAPADDGLEDFSSLQGVAAQFWKEHGDGLRRAPALEAALKADRPETVELGEELYAEEHYWSPGTVQFARRVRAVDALNGDLLLGHVLGAHQCKNQIVARRGAATAESWPPRHRRDARSTAWRCGLSPLDSASTATFSPRKDLVKNYRVPNSLIELCTGPTHY